MQSLFNTIDGFEEFDEYPDRRELRPDGHFSDVLLLLSVEAEFVDVASGETVHVIDLCPFTPLGEALQPVPMGAVCFEGKLVLPLCEIEAERL